MNLEKMLDDLGFAKPERILVNLGEERILTLIREMLADIEPPVNVLVWKAYYGIDCQAVPTKQLGERLNPPLKYGRVSEIRRTTKQMLRSERRIQILASVVSEIPKPP